MGYAFNEVDEYRMDEWRVPERPKTGLNYKHFNVLWIEWQDKIAYCKGLGCIWKDVWGNRALEWIDLTLG